MLVYEIQEIVLRVTAYMHAGKMNLKKTPANLHEHRRIQEMIGISVIVSVR